MESALGMMLIGLLVGFGIFLILRELMCWYWKVNSILAVLERIEARLGHAAAPPSYASNPPPSYGVTAAGVPAGVATETCPFCHEPSSRASSVCETCGRTKR